MERNWLSNPTVVEYDGPFWSKPKASNTFTMQGAAFKILILLSILMIAFGYTWKLGTQGYAEAYAPDSLGVYPDSITIPDNVINLILTGSIGGFIVALVIIVSKKSAPFFSPIYAALEGVALGGISAAFEAKYPGISLQAVGATLGTAVSMFVLYSFEIIKPTEKFKLGLISAMFGIIALYSIDLIMGLFGSYVPVLHSSGYFGMGLQIIIVIIAALNLILDFDLISTSSENKAPKWFEWYAAFSLLVTLVWLYLEILKLLAKMKSNDD